MNTQNERATVEKMLTAYADALNYANTALIPSFYAEDGLIMPDGFRELTIHNLVERSKSFFDKVRFQIDYALPETVIDGEYAFVKTIAKTTTVNLESNQEIKQTSRDFFVFRKEKEDWKIYRYIFNKMKVN